MKLGKIDTQLVIKEYDGQIVLETILSLLQANEVMLLLNLLQNGEEKGIEIGFKKFRIQIQHDIDTENTCKLFDSNVGICKIQIDKNLLGYFIAFLNKYCKDGYGSAEHIDMDFSYNKSQEITLTIKLKSYQEFSHIDGKSRIIKR